MQGFIEANNSVLISGIFKGDIKAAGLVYFAKDASVEGDISYRSIIVENGSKLFGLKIPNNNADIQQCTIKDGLSHESNFRKHDFNIPIKSTSEELLNFLDNAEDQLDKRWYDSELINGEFNELSINQKLTHTENKSNENYYNSLPFFHTKNNSYNFSAEEFLKQPNRNIVKLKNPVTGEIKQLKVGWSWTCFIFSSTFGIPLFLRELNGWGAVMCCISILLIYKNMLILSSNLFVINRISLDFMGLTLALLGLGLSIWLGISANKLYGLKLLEKGWLFSEPNSKETLFAKEQWEISHT